MSKPLVTLWKLKQEVKEIKLEPQGKFPHGLTAWKGNWK